MCAGLSLTGNKQRNKETGVNKAESIGLKLHVK